MEQNKTWENTERFVAIKKFLGRVYQKRWYVLASLLVAVSLAFLYNRYIDPIYAVRADFVAKKFEEGNNNYLGGVLESNNKTDMSASAVILEIPLLKSTDIVEATLERMDIGTSYFKEGKLKTTEIYKPYRYTVFTDSTSKNIPYDFPIHLYKESDFTFTLSTENAYWSEKLGKESFDFGKSYEIDGWKFMVTINRELKEANGEAYYFIINHPNKLVGKYRSMLNISWATKGSALLNVFIRSELPEREHDFLNTYFDVLIEKKLEEKNQHLTNTINFINDYMTNISDTIIKYQKENDQIRLENREVINGSEFVFSKLSELDQKKTQYLLENTYYDNLLEYVEENRTSEVFAPNLIGIDAPILNELINNFIDIQWGEKVDLNEENFKNPLVTKSNEEIVNVEKNLYEIIKNLKQDNRRKIQEIESQTRFYYNSIDDFQLTSREYVEVRRMLSLYENLFNTLLSKRTDAYINKASTTSDYQIVTPPWYSRSPIYPDSNRNYLLALLFGLGLPLGLIYFIDLANDKIIDKDDLQKNTNIPIIGNVGHSTVQGNLVVLNKPKSLISEAFRGIRANLKYLNNDKENQVFLITSSISSEGKTFCSINLAYTYAIAGNRTLLIGADMRKPNLARDFDIHKETGLSEYLGGFANKEETIYETARENLFVMPSGKVPPNPAELLNTPRMVDLMKWLRHNYDIIIFDTPPIGLVADAMELLKYTDINLLIVRQFRTFKKSLSAVTEMYNDKKIDNLGIIFNDINFIRYEYGYGYGKNYGYGYGYGHGYGYYEEDEEKKKGWWKKVFSKN